MKPKYYGIVSLIFFCMLFFSRIPLQQKIWGFLFVVYSVFLTYLYLEVIEPSVRQYYQKRYNVTLKREITLIGISWWPMGDLSVANKHWFILNIVPMALLVSILIGGGLVLLVPALFVFSIW